MKHWHLDVREYDGMVRRGALATTEPAARAEARVEVAGDGRRSVTVQACDSECFGRSR